MPQILCTFLGLHDSWGAARPAGYVRHCEAFHHFPARVNQERIPTRPTSPSPCQALLEPSSPPGIDLDGV